MMQGLTYELVMQQQESAKRDGGCGEKHTYEHEGGCRKLHNKGKKEREPLLVIPGAEIRT